MKPPEFQPSRSGNSKPSVMSEAIQALVSLGYKQSEAQKVVRDTIQKNNLQERMQNEDLSTENLLSMAMGIGQTKSEPSSVLNEADASTREYTEKPETGELIEKPPVDNRQQPSPPPASAKPEPASESMANTGLDAVQTGLDVAGVADPTPVSDGANAALSLGRAAMDPKNAGKHLLNAGISVVSMIPYLGDMAKGFKYGGKAAKEAKGANAAEGTKSATEQFEAILGSGSGSGLGGSGGSPPASDQPTPGSDPASEGNLKPMTDKALEVAGVFGTVITSGLAYAKSTDLLNRTVLEYHRHISGFNGELAEAYGKLETGRQQRDMQNAADYGGSVAGLAEQQNVLEESFRDFQAPFTEMGTDIQTGLTMVANNIIQIIDFIEPFSELYPLIKEWLGFKGNDDPKADGGYFDTLRARANNFKQKDKV